MYSLRLASTGSTGLGFALRRFVGNTGTVAAHGGRRSVSTTSIAAAPVPGDQGVGMDPAKQLHAPEGKQQDKNNRDDMHKTHGDVMTDSFGEAYWTRSVEEGFGGVYGQNDPDYDTSQGSEGKEKEKEKARHDNDDKHAT